MFPKKERVVSLLEAVDREIALLLQMTSPIACPEDFVTSLTGMTVFRASGMSLQYITENLVKIRNLCGMQLFGHYPSIPWLQVFGMLNFLSHEYVDVDAEGIFNTIMDSIPPLRDVVGQMLSDVRSGRFDNDFKD